MMRKISTSGWLRSEDLMVHRDTPENNEGTPFEFSAPNMVRLGAMMRNYPVGFERSAVLGALDLVQRQCGWVPISAMHRIAEILQMPRVRVYECATFYGMVKRSYRGQFHVKVCVTTPCMLRGSDVILQAAEQACCCEVGDVSADGLFGVDPVQCAGACVNAPVLVVNDDYYEDMRVADVHKVITCLRMGGIPNPGPQSGRYAAEPISGQTTLLCPPPGPGFCIQPALCC